MSVRQFFREIVFRTVGRFYIPPHIEQMSEKRILHISDTPTEFYPAVKRLIDKIKPQILIHTGDLADDIKLEFNSARIDKYQKAVKAIINVLEESNADEIYIIPGNHDSIKIINKYMKRAIVLCEGEIISVDDLKLGLAHRVKCLPLGADLNLYGHNFDPGPQEERLKYLNGLNDVNVIFYPSRLVYKLPYPYAINAHRKMESHYGVPGSI